MMVAANKCDLLEPDSVNLQRLRDHVAALGCDFYEISAATTMGTRHLMQAVAAMLQQLPPITVYEPEYIRPLAQAGDPTELEIEHYGDTWVISGAWMERLLGDINFDDFESRNYFDRQLRKCGLFDRLEGLGIRDGDTVSIYNWEFTYEK